MAAHRAGHARHSPLSSIAILDPAQTVPPLPSAALTLSLPGRNDKFGGRRRLDGRQHVPNMWCISEAVHL